MKDVQAGVVYLIAAAVLGYLWLSGEGARGVDALRSGLEGRRVDALATYRFFPRRAAVPRSGVA